MKNKKQLLFIIFSLLTLIIITLNQDKIRQLLSLAAPKKANLIVDVNSPQTALQQTWSAFAQGGEEPPPMLTSTINKMKNLSPRYIRLDHLYDYYDIVKKNGDKFTFDFSKLDKTVDDIITFGALPFLSLSYMPSSFTASGSVIDVPEDWNNWKNLIMATVEHYSGKNNRNLSNVYYEVWNEPDLPQFGGWKLYGEKDYRLLYYHASLGAKEAKDTNIFYFGGPAVGSYYSHWVTGFAFYVAQNNLRLDFYSWHRYSRNKDIFLSDAINIRKNLSDVPKFSNLPLVLTEWGIESENDPISNSDMAAAFSLSAISKFYRDINLAFTFEVKDGPPPNGGKWGLLTHEKNPENPLTPKPRYKLFEQLSKLKGKILPISGEGTYISGMASGDNQTVHLIISNFDLSKKNTENVPVTFRGLSPSSYNISYIYPLTGVKGNWEVISTNGIISKDFLMASNSIVYIELSQTGKLASFIPGARNQVHDQALMMSVSDSPLVFSFPEFRLLPEGSISFDLKPFWTKDNTGSFIIFEAPFITEGNTLNKILLVKQKTLEGNLLVFKITSPDGEYTIKEQIDSWDESRDWHHLEFKWSPESVQMSVDGQIQELKKPVDVRNGKALTFYPVFAAIDNLRIGIGKMQTITRNYDGDVFR